jgi:hypothetical protein
MPARLVIKCHFLLRFYLLQSNNNQASFIVIGRFRDQGWESFGLSGFGREVQRSGNRTRTATLASDSLCIAEQLAFFIWWDLSASAAARRIFFRESGSLVRHGEAAVGAH